MAWSNPALCSFHAAIDDGQATPFTADEAMESGFPLTNLFDNRMQTQARWSTSGTGHYIEIDRGATGRQSTVDRLIIVNHNLFGKKVKVQSGATPNPTTSTRVAEVTVFATEGAQEVAVFDFDAATSDRYIRISFPTTAVQPQIGQVFLTKTETFTAAGAGGGPVQGWEYEQVMGRQVFADGEMLEDDPIRWRLALDFRKVDSTDLAAMKRMLTGYGSSGTARHNGARPVVVFAPYHTTAASGLTTNAHIMRLIEWSEEADVTVPADNDYLARIGMEFLEQLA